MTPLEQALLRFENPDIPVWGPHEEEIDEPSWRLSDQPSDPALPGGGLSRHSMLYIGEGCNRMFLIHKGKIIWSYCTGKGWEYDDIWMMTNGHILFSRMGWAAEITPEKQEVWRYTAPEGCEIHSLQPIGLDRVLMMLNANPLPRAIILHKRTGMVEMDHPVPYPPDAPVHGQFRRFRLTREGTFLAPYLSLGKVVEYDKDFHELWHYSIPSPWAAVRLKNGNTLITGEAEGVHREVDAAGNTVWEIYLHELPAFAGIQESQSCVRLENGNTILCSRGSGGTTPQLVEVTPDKQVVWVLNDWKHLGPATAVQILTESGIPEHPGECQR